MSKLQQHFMKEHDLMLLDSEVHDILELARGEIELPTKFEIDLKYPTKGLVLTEDGKFKGSATIEMWQNAMIKEGIEWALGKVRNPYPRPM